MKKWTFSRYTSPNCVSSKTNNNYPGKSIYFKIPPASNPFVWIPGWPGCPPQGMARHFAEPPGLNPLSRFIELAHTQLRDNFVPALLSLSCMLMMANYR